MEDDWCIAHKHLCVCACDWFRVRVRVRVTVGLGLGVRVRARARVRPDVIECKPLPARAALKQQGQRDRPQPG